MEIINPISNDERNWGMFCHLAALAGFIFPFGNIIGPLIVWSLKKDVYPFVDECGRESLNFQISLTIYIFVSVLLIILLVGIMLLFFLGFLNLVLVVIAAVKANSGESFTYPMSIRFIQ